MRPNRVGLLLAVFSACATTQKPERLIDAVPERAATSGEALLGWIPGGAEVLVEVDVARIRDNATVGPIVALMDKLPVKNPLGLNWDLIVGIDAIVSASYQVGRANAATVTLVRGEGVSRIANATRLDARTVVLADAVWTQKVQAAGSGKISSMRADHSLLRIRTVAMPEAAEAAAFRVSAKLDFKARVALVREFDLEFAPRTVSLWADVVDDFATVVVLEEGTAARAKSMGKALQSWSEQAAMIPMVRAARLSRAIRSMRVVRQGRRVRAVLLIGPARLQNVVKRVTGKIGES